MVFIVKKQKALALLTCFHGPKVELCFSELGEILEAQSSMMQIDTFDALHMILYKLQSSSKSSCMQLFCL